jgi:hypothetical protein
VPILTGLGWALFSWAYDFDFGPDRSFWRELPMEVLGGLLASAIAFGMGQVLGRPSIAVQTFAFGMGVVGLGLGSSIPSIARSRRRR